MNNIYDIAVVGGAGHVGLPLSIVFALKGLKVLVLDKDKKALHKIKQGQMPFMEYGSDDLLPKALQSGKLSLSDDASEIAGAGHIVVTIGTPVDEFLSPSLKPIAQCMDELIPFLHDKQDLVLRSTVYPGVTTWVAHYLSSKGLQTRISFCPERIVQGYAIEELQTLPQIVSGFTQEAEDNAAKLFSVIAPSVVRMQPMEAELAKLFSNAYRYIQFAVANQFYMIAQSAGVDYYNVLAGLTKDYERAKDIPKAGFAAGPCLFKDTMQLSAFFKNQFSLGFSAMLVNEGLPGFIVDQLAKKYDLAQSTVGLLGMAFKADIDDTRASLSYKLKKLLAFRCKEVLTTDPWVKNDPELYPLEEVVEKCDVMVLCVPHSVYREINFKDKAVLDVWKFID